MGVRYQAKTGSVELPKLTLALSQMMDAADREQDGEGRCRLMHAFLAEVFGEELPGLIDGETVEECDLVELGVLYAGVTNAYAAPVAAEQRKRINSQIESVKPAIEAMARLQEAQSRQGFRNVR